MYLFNRKFSAILLCFGCTTVQSVYGQTSTPADAQVQARANSLLQQMSLDEKLQFIASKYPSNASPGGGGGFIPGIPRLGIPDLNMVDSATGSGSTTQASSTFPATIALAASWEPHLSYDYGVQVAKQLRAQGFGMGLGGGVNLTREPRAGRTFEYLGEDPILAGELLAERTNGTQSQRVIATAKHFAGNEQETNRMGGNSQIDERTMRELYLLPFEIALEKSHPLSLMCAYTRLNGDYACENKFLLTSVLKNEWKFQGEVQSDWGATHSTVKAINAGLDEEEGSDAGPAFLAPVPVRSVLASRAVSQDRLDDMIRRKLYVLIASGVMDDAPKGGGTIDFVGANSFAQSVEEQSIVLLRNQSNQLPVKINAPKRIAVIGAHADAAVMTGGGSADTFHPVTGAFAGCGGLRFAKTDGCGWWRSPWLKVDVPLTKALQQLSPSSIVSFAGNRDENAPFRDYTPDEIRDAVALARNADVAIVVVAQPAGEDFGDLQSLSLSNPLNQNQLVEAVADVNPHTVVVIESGNPVLMPWKDKVSAIVEAWYPGEAGGKAIANVLFGKVNPSGKLPISFPLHDQDSPTWGTDGAFAADPIYTEKLDIGYRWYDVHNIKPLYEFGYGLSYTHFSYSNLSVEKTDEHGMVARFSVTNDGRVAGAEVAQVYLDISSPGEPPRRLGGWAKVSLTPGDKREVRVVIPPKALRVWSLDGDRWEFVVPSKVEVGSSSRDIQLSSQ
jgi:beta-glucosidase